jgi:acyl carrier protein
MPQVLPFPTEMQLEWRVKDRLAVKLAMDSDEISMNFRLRSDLGMDGDDAVEFFDRYAEDFGVDLHELKAGWQFYFGPERAALSRGTKLAMIAGVSAWLIQAMLYPQLSTFFALVTAAALSLIVWLAVEIAERLNRDPEIPVEREITVGELVEHARTGIWKVPEDIQKWVLKQEQ